MTLCEGFFSFSVQLVPVRHADMLITVMFPVLSVNSRPTQPAVGVFVCVCAFVRDCFCPCEVSGLLRGVLLEAL